MNTNEMINMMPSMARQPKPQAMPSPTEQSSLIISQVIPQILNFISRELPIKKDLEATKQLHESLTSMIETLHELVESNNTPKFTEDVASKFSELIDKLNSPIVTVNMPTDGIKAVEDAVRGIKFEPTEIVKVSNISEITKAINDIKPLLVNLSSTIEDSKIEVSEDVVLDKESKKYLKNLEFLETDAKNPIAVRLSDGKEFYKAVGDLNGGIRAMTGSSGNNFLTPTGSPTKANVDSNNNLRVSQDNYTVKIVYASAGKPEYIGKAVPGTASSGAGWQIQKLTYSGTDVTDIKWAGGSLSFTNIFDNYASFTYS
jgi:hypothetical protein